MRLLSLMIVFSLAALAAPIDIVSALTPPPSNGTQFPRGAVAVSFTTADTYSNVSISIVTSNMANARAYLTTKLGPGTSSSDEIAVADFAFPGGTFVQTPVLSIPILFAGVYFLTIEVTGGTANVFGDAAGLRQIINLAPGAAYGPSSLALPSAYAPGGDFTPLGNHLDLLVRGESATSAVPEPRSLVLALLALLAAFPFHRPRRSSPDGVS